MPGVKTLHQSSEDNNKPEFVMGHFWGALSVLAHAGSRVFAVPLRLNIQDGIKSSPSQKGTIITRMKDLVASTAAVVGTVVADCQYACRPMLKFDFRPVEAPLMPRVLHADALLSPPTPLLMTAQPA